MNISSEAQTTSQVHTGFPRSISWFREDLFKRTTRWQAVDVRLVGWLSALSTQNLGFRAGSLDILFHLKTGLRNYHTELNKPKVELMKCGVCRTFRNTQYSDNLIFKMSCNLTWTMPHSFNSQNPRWEVQRSGQVQKLTILREEIRNLDSDWKVITKVNKYAVAAMAFSDDTPSRTAVLECFVVF